MLLRPLIQIRRASPRARRGLRALGGNGEEGGVLVVQKSLETWEETCNDGEKKKKEQEEENVGLINVVGRE